MIGHVKFAFVLLLIAVTAFAQSSFKIADSSSSGTYKQMFAELKSVCDSPDLSLEEAPQKGGAVENLEALKNNQVSGAFLHSDVIMNDGAGDPNTRLYYKTLVALYPEEVHVLALRNSKATAVKKGLIYNTNVPFEFTSLQDLAGYNVGAAGGGVITARILTGQGEGHFNVVAFDKGDDVINALRSGQIHAAIFVGGAPLPNISGLSANEFKLLPVGSTIAGKVAAWYKPANIKYTNLKSDQIQTIAPWALLVTRKYTTPKMIDALSKFRACFYAKLSELQETPGMHAKWQLVDPANRGVWEWYELPTAVAPVARPTKK